MVEFGLADGAYVTCPRCHGLKVVLIDSPFKQNPAPQWVTVNLPWELPDQGDSEEYRIARMEYRKVIDVEMAQAIPRDPNDTSDTWNPKKLEQVRNRAPEVDTKDQMDTYYLARVLDKYPDDADVCMLARGRHRVWRQSQFLKNHPETAKYQAVMDAIHKKIMASQFCTHPANKPGVLLDVQMWNNDRTKIFIGDVLTDGAGSGQDSTSLCLDGATVIAYMDLSGFKDG